MNGTGIKCFIRNLIFRYPKIKKPRLYMTLLVKNEIDIIEKNLIFHKKMGVDGFIVTDNGSSDGTYEVLEKYKNQGIIKELILDKEPAYNQNEKVNKMILIARDKYNADWVMNVDADEFWYSGGHDLKKEISKSTQNVIKCPMVNVYPDEEEFINSCYVVDKTSFEKEKYDFPTFSLYNQQFPKVAHRVKGYKMISMGNHNADMTKKSEKISKDILIYHYSVRGKEHFKNKMVNGAIAAYKVKGDNPNISTHWKYFYERLVVEGADVETEYNRYIGKEYFNELVARGILKYDNRVKTFMEEI